MGQECLLGRASRHSVCLNVGKEEWDSSKKCAMSYELKSESWVFLFEFSVCVGSRVKAEAGSGDGKAFSECKLLWSDSCSE